jgi:D-alanyl-D-alanine carboxypeptidase
MLPSGNDAAYCLAEYFGRILERKKYQGCDFINSFKGPVSFFIKEMNYNASHVGLTYTNFDSPHGLPNHLNYSNAFDIAKLSAKCMKNF